MTNEKMVERCLKLTDEDKARNLDSEELDVDEIEWEYEEDIPTRPPTMTGREYEELLSRMESEICEFQAELKDGKLYAGRTPLKDEEAV